MSFQLVRKQTYSNLRWKNVLKEPRRAATNFWIVSRPLHTAAEPTVVLGVKLMAAVDSFQL